MKLKNDRLPAKSYVFELFAGNKKIGISVACDITQALLFAMKATTRKTSSKMDTTCDFEQLQARQMGTSNGAMVTLDTALASQARSIPLNADEIQKEGRLTRVQKGSAYVGAPSMVRCTRRPRGVQPKLRTA
ncbi:hypothetical protein [Rhodoferax ferrireducens]|nr:hypothetical protein [Rhodoferax ferrireducens]